MSDMIVTKGNGGISWFVAGAAVVALAIGGFLYADGYFDKSSGVQLKIDLPQVEIEGN